MLKITTDNNSVNLIKDGVNVRSSKLGVLSYNFSEEGLGFYLPNSSTPFVSGTFADGVELNGEAITADNVNERLSEVFFLNDSGSDTAAIEEHNTNAEAHTDIREKVSEVEAIVRGKARALVFDTVAALDAWLTILENVATLQVGDNFYIKATDVPDYWWDGTQKQALEGEKVNVSNVVTTDTAQTIGGRKIFTSATPMQIRNSSTSRDYAELLFAGNTGAIRGSFGISDPGSSIGYVFFGLSDKTAMLAINRNTKAPYYVLDGASSEVYHTGNLDVPAYEQRISELESQVQAFSGGPKVYSRTLIGDTFTFTLPIENGRHTIELTYSGGYYVSLKISTTSYKSLYFRYNGYSGTNGSSQSTFIERENTWNIYAQNGSTAGTINSGYADIHLISAAGYYVHLYVYLAPDKDSVSALSTGFYIIEDYGIRE